MVRGPMKERGAGVLLSLACDMTLEGGKNRFAQTCIAGWICEAWTPKCTIWRLS